MELVQIITLVLVAGLFVLEGMKIYSSIISHKEKRHDIAHIMEMIEDGQVEGTVTEVKLPKDKE